MAPITTYLFAFAAPTPLPSSLQPRDSANFTIYAESSNPAINNLVFGLYPFADGYEQGYLYNHTGIPISINDDYFLQTNPDGLGDSLVVSVDSSLKILLEDGGNVSGDSVGTPGFFVEPGTFNFGYHSNQDLFVACPWTGASGTGILYTVGWVYTGAPVPEGCETFHLHNPL